MSTPSNTRSLARSRLVTLLARRLPIFLLVSLLSVVVSALAGVVPWVSKRIIDQIGAGFSWHAYLFWLSLLLGSLLVREIVSGLVMIFASRLQQRVVHELLQEIYTGAMQQPAVRLARDQSGTLASHILNDVQAVAMAVPSAIEALVRYPLEILAVLAVLLWIDPRLTLFACGVAVVVFVAAARKSHMLGEASKALLDTKASLFGVVNENITLYKVVRLFHNIEHRAALVREMSVELMTRHLSMLTRRWLVSVMATSVVAVALTGALGYVGWRISTGAITGGDVTAIFVGLLALQSSLKGLVGAVTDLRASLHSGEYIRDLLEPKGPPPSATRGTKSPTDPIRSIEFQSVSFDYDGKPVLAGINLRLQPGRPAVLIGPNGAGKTTLIDLLFGLMDPSQGAILVNGLDIRDVRETDLRTRMSLVPQSSDLFSGTVRYNIEFGRLGASGDEVQRAARLARVDTLLDEKQATLDYEVGQRGGRLSVGEQQRVSIARACIRDPEVLVLDESTASLDAVTETTIWDLVRTLAPHRIVVVVTHSPWPPDLPVDVYRVDKGAVTRVEPPPVVL